jgi:hypothetical protein
MQMRLPLPFVPGASAVDLKFLHSSGKLAWELQIRKPH